VFSATKYEKGRGKGKPWKNGKDEKPCPDRTTLIGNSFLFFSPAFSFSLLLFR